MDNYSTYTRIIKVFIGLVFYCFLTCNIIQAQDVIYKKDHTEIKSKIVEIGDSDIKFIDLNRQDDTLICSISVSDVFMIIYANGERELFKQTVTNGINNNVDAVSESFSGISDKVEIKFYDKRAYPLIIGEKPGVIVGTKMKVKDKDNEWFPGVNEIFKERLTKKGFIEKISNPDYLLEIDINELSFNSMDKFTHIQIDQLLSAKITVEQIKDNQILYSSDLSSSYSCKAADIRENCEKNGYKWRNNYTLFLFVIDDIIQKLLADFKLYGLI
ncbi:MAG: hypothetical protein JW894_04865 [Bacteroidales bacterium]|nr:hypothetical protein [Bacteroidales bacterium]